MNIPGALKQRKDFMKNLSVLLPLFLFSSLYSSDYFPISIGNIWVMDILDSTGMVIGTDSASIGKDTTLSNINMFQYNEYWQKPAETDSAFFYIYSQGNDIYIDFDRTQVTPMRAKFCQHQYTEGDHWTSFYDDCYADYYGRVTVPAGSFDSCFFVHIGPSDSAGWIFAPDVGVIKSISNNRGNYVLRNYFVSAPISIANRMKNNLTQLTPINAIVHSYPGKISISFDNPNHKNVRLSIYTMKGEKIPGINRIDYNYCEWNPLNSPSGTYIVIIAVGNETFRNRILLTR